MEITEVWKDIPGYEGLYQVSSFGRIRSLNRIVHHSKGQGNRVLYGKILNYGINKKGYKHTALSKNGKVKSVRHHQLVAIAFIPNPLNLPEVNHKDENKTNNHADNLEWCTHLYNIRYGTGIKRGAMSRLGISNCFGEDSPRSKLTNQQVIDIYNSNMRGRDLAKIYNVGEPCISEIKNKKAWRRVTINL